MFSFLNPFISIYINTLKRIEMSAYFHHSTIRKYTLALLDTFNDIEVERTLSNGNLDYKIVPITYGSRDKAFVFSKLDTEQWLTNNYNVLPRMALSLTTMNKDDKRNTNKLFKINKTINGKSQTFQYNATAWNFNFELAVATRSMTEMTMVIEQIVARFNPTYNLSLMEISIQQEPTTVVLALTGTEIDTPNNIGQDDDIRIVTAVFNFELRGNIYQPFKIADMIEEVRLYYSIVQGNDSYSDAKRGIKYQFSVDDNGMEIPSTATTSDWYESFTVAKNPPVISAITGATSISVGSESDYSLIFDDPDAEDGFTYVWTLVNANGVATINQNNVNPCVISANAVGTFILVGQMVDSDGNVSNSMQINVTVA